MSLRPSRRPQQRDCSNPVYHTYYIDAVAIRYWDAPDDAGGLDGTQVRQNYLHDAQFNA